MKPVFFQWLMFALPVFAFTQALPITIDGYFDDWTTEAVFLGDSAGDGNFIDFLSLQVANDEEYLYLRLETQQEFVLTSSNELRLWMDTDLAASTGFQVGGIGAELELSLGTRSGLFFYNGVSHAIELRDVGFHHLPTFSSNIFEIAISRMAVPRGLAPLFPGTGVRIFLREGNSGDQMPEGNLHFTYFFKMASLPSFPLVSLSKTQPEHIRLLTWNTLNTGLKDSNRRPHFQKVLAVLSPDIITLNECWSMNATEAVNFMNEILPLGGFQSWQAVKSDAGNITLSRFPFVAHWSVLEGHRITAALINLPDDTYPADFLIINAHLKCCKGHDDTRQMEADAIAAFIHDAKRPGGIVTVPESTPWVIAGDLNIVGSRQPLTTLLEGKIVHSGIFGQGGAPDWDETFAEDVISLQTDRRMAFTWQSQNSSFPPSRLDYHILSDGVLKVEKTFILNTAAMSAARLAENGLSAENTSLASDHLPKVTDVSINVPSGVVQLSENQKISAEIYPNPANTHIRLMISTTQPSPATLYLEDIHGIRSESRACFLNNGVNLIEYPLQQLPAGLYLMHIISPEGRLTLRLLRL